nr:aminoacetone oxidase family FAD-binding enzyme [Campylobacter curvus]
MIVGGGAAGLFTAANLRGKSIAILEKNATAGKKIVASGGGRCNITNRHISAKNYVGDHEFISNILKNLKFNDVLKFFNELKFSEQNQSQFFCDSGSRDVLGVLLRRTRQSGTEIIYDAEVIAVVQSQNFSEIFEVLTANGEKFLAKNIIVASGGVSYKSLGISDIALKIASNFGLKFSPFAPALVGFTVQRSEFWFKNLSGICFGAQVRVAGRELAGDVLFTHKGISGPAMLNASLFWQKGAINVNFAPKFDPRNLRGTRKQISTLLPLPRRFMLGFLQAVGVRDGAFDELSEAQKSEVLRLFDYSFAPAGTFGFERAEVSRGGVDTKGLGANLECKSVRGLYFVGEALDVTGMLGGYNLHFAFASALAAARDINLGSVTINY